MQKKFSSGCAASSPLNPYVSSQGFHRLAEKRPALPRRHGAASACARLHRPRVSWYVNLAAMAGVKLVRLDAPAKTVDTDFLVALAYARCRGNDGRFSLGALMSLRRLLLSARTP